MSGTKISIEDSGLKLLLATIFLIVLIGPFATLAHFLIPAPPIFGKSFWVAAPFIILVGIAIRFGEWKTKQAVFSTSMLYLICIGIIAARTIVFNEEVHSEGMRYIVTIPIYFIVAKYVAKNKKLNDFISIAIIAQGVAVAIVMYFNAQFAPQVSLIQTDLGVSGITTTGNNPRTLLIGVSIGSGHIILAMTVLIDWLGRIKLKFGTSFAIYVFLLFSSYVITLGGSRLPIVVSVAMVALMFYQNRESRKAFVHSLLFVFFVVVLGKYLSILLQIYPGVSYGNPIWRFGENSGGRGEKLLLAMKLLGQSWETFLFGVSNSQQILARSNGGYVFSDNSYAYIALNLGLPASILLVKKFYDSIVELMDSAISRLFLLYFFVCLGVTNAVLWDPFLFSAILTMALNHARKLGKKNVNGN